MRLTLEQLLQAYDAGELTRGELVIHTLTVLPSVEPEAVELALRQRPAELAALVEWGNDVLAGAELFCSSGGIVLMTEEHRRAIERLCSYVSGLSGRERGATDPP